MLGPALPAMAWMLPFVLAPPSAVTDAHVDQAVEQAVDAILAAQQQQWELTVAANGKKTRVATGRLLERADAGVLFAFDDGQVLRVPADRIVSLRMVAAHWPEQEGVHEGGRTALATFALLSAGRSRHEAPIKHALAWLEEAELPGTYSRALRANVWALLFERDLRDAERQKYRRLLRQDEHWLERAIYADGWYDYRAPVNRQQARERLRAGDHSCTQFGVLGMWACANVLKEVPPAYWQLVEKHWLETQRPSGAWAYGRGNYVDRETMVSAGVNSLYVVLDKRYATGGQGYRRLVGIRKSTATVDGERRVLRGIHHGLAWMNEHMLHARQVHHWQGYRQFGLERLGVASGLKYIGQRDWYREGAEVAVARQWGGDFAEDALWLLFLVYGRAPVVFNKLQTGPQESWDYYLRDLHFLCRYFNRRFENIHRWQIVSTDSSLHDLRDAPILYVSGTGAFELTAGQLGKIKTYCDKGGTVIGHADLCSPAFIDSFKQTFGRLFRERGWRFRPLPREHPVYTASGQSAADAPNVPLEGMSDGNRVFIFLFPKDVAGAWHRDLTATQADLFEIMLNIRRYAAPTYRRLPGRLRPQGFAGKPAAVRGKIRLARLDGGGLDASVNPTAWQEIGEWAQQHRGLLIDATMGLAPDSAEELKEYDVIHIAGRGTWQPGSVLRRMLREYVQAGGLILADAVVGDEQFISSFREYLEAEFGPTIRALERGHLIVTGACPGGRALARLEPTRWAMEELGNRGVPPLVLAGPLAEPGVIFCPFDLTASINGHYVFGLKGYEVESARHVAANILAYRLARPADGKPYDAPPPTEPEAKDLEELLKPEGFSGEQ